MYITKRIATYCKLDLIMRILYNTSKFLQHNYTAIRDLALLTIGVARGGHGRAFALPSFNFALPSKPSSYLKLYI